MADNFSQSATTINKIITECTNAYLEQLDLDDLPSYTDMEVELLTSIRQAVSIENTSRSKGDCLHRPDRLSESQIAQILLYIYKIININFDSEACSSDKEHEVLAIYQDSGENEGIYVFADEFIRKATNEFNRRSSKSVRDNVIAIIKDNAPSVTRTTNMDLIPLQNGIFDFKNKVLLPFSDEYVFVAKSKVAYNPFAQNQVIHNDDDGTDWDVESWMDDITDDIEIRELLWQVLGAVVRPFVPWNKAAFFYATTGNNGKGTLCELMRQLCGDGVYANIPITQFKTDFGLEPILRANCIITDENNVGDYIDKAADFKSIITNDPVSVNRKGKQVISYRFEGFMVQCLNDFPRFKDKSESLYRRLLLVPFEKCFTGKERKYIKTDYLHRKDVLEYVMYKLMHMNFYSLSEPKACKELLADFIENNDPVKQFMEEILKETVWDLLPFTFMYDLYKAWFKKNSSSGIIQGRNTFINEVLSKLKDFPDWYSPGRKCDIRPGNKMDKPEYMIADYDLVDWKNPTYTGGDLDKICMPKLKVNYTGILRK